MDFIFVLCSFLFLFILDHPAAGIFCRLQVAGCRLKFNYNWKTAGTKNN